MQFKNRKFMMMFSFSLLLLILFSIISLSVQAHEGHANQAPWLACEEKSINDSCSYQTVTTLYKGTFRSIKSSLMCEKSTVNID